MSKKFLFAAPLALAAGALLTAPAQAAPWNNAGQIRAEINQLDRQIDRMRGLSQREERRLENRVDQLQRLYRDYARGGFNRGELIRLQAAVNSLKSDIFAQSRDRNGRNDRHDRFDRDHDRGHRR